MRQYTQKKGNLPKKKDNKKRARFTKKKRVSGGAQKKKIYEFTDNFYKFTDNFYECIQEINPGIQLLYMQLSSSEHFVENLAYFSEKTAIDIEFLLLVVHFCIITHRNAKYCKFIQTYFGIEKITVLTSSFLRSLIRDNTTVGGSGSAPKMQITYKSMWITSMLAMLYYGFLFYNTTHILIKESDKHPAIMVMKRGSDILRKCTIDKQAFIPKTQGEIMLFRLMQTFIGNSDELQNLNYFTKYIHRCFTDPSGDVENEMMRESVLTPEFRDTIKYPYSARPLPAPTAEEPEPEIDVIRSTDRVSSYSSKSEPPLYSRTWISRQDSEKQLVPVDTTGSELMIQEIIQKDPTYFNELYKQINKDLHSKKTIIEVKTYIEQLASMDEQAFKDLLGTPETSVLDTINTVLTHMQDFKHIISYFSTEYGFNKAVLAASGVDITSMLYTEFKRVMRDAQHELEIKISNTKKVAEHIVDDSIILINITKANMVNFYRLLMAFGLFLVSSSVLLRKFMQDRRRKNSPLKIEDVKGSPSKTLSVKR